MAVEEKFDSPEHWYHTLGTHYICAQAYFHLNRVGVLELLLQRPRSAAELAQQLNLDQRILSTVLEYVAMVDVLIATDGQQFSISEFGRAIIRRYSREERGALRLNMFDVRVGGFGVVWSHLAELMTTQLVYGQDLHRNNAFVESGLYKLAAKLVDPILAILDQTGTQQVIELGANTGIADKILELRPELEVLIVDRNSANLEDAKKRIAEKGLTARARFALTDIFHTDNWLPQAVDAQARPLLFSVHFHEFIKAGVPQLVALFQRIRTTWPHAEVAILEQPRNQPGDRPQLSQTQWLYSHANVLLHHIVASGRILFNEEWVQMLAQAQLRLAGRTPTNYLGFEVLHFQ